MGKTIDELRAELADTENECRAAYRSYRVIRINGPNCCTIEKRHAWERYDAAIDARDAAETALFAALDGEAPESGDEPEEVREPLTVGPWVTCVGGVARKSNRGHFVAFLNAAGWSLGIDGVPTGMHPETGQQGRDAADAALRAAGVVLL